MHESIYKKMVRAVKSGHRLNVVYFHQYFNTPEMSGSTRSYEVARTLVLRGHNVTVVTSDRAQRSGFGTRWENVSGINICWCAVPYRNQMGFWQRTYAFALFSIMATIHGLRLKADIVFATSTPLTIGIPGLICSFFKRCPLIFEIRDLWPEMPIATGAIRNRFLICGLKRFESYIYRSSKAIVALSPGMKSGAVEAGPSPSSKVAVIPNFAEIEDFTFSDSELDEFRLSAGWKKEKPTVLYAGTIGPINGCDWLVRLAEKCPDIDFRVYGEGKKKEELFEFAQRKGVLNRNFFIDPPMSKMLARRAFRACTAVAVLFTDVPEMRKNSANKFFDGLAAGKPIIINFGGWIEDLVLRANAGRSAWR